MSTPRLVTRRVMGLKTETAQSTAVALAATDFTYVKDLVITPTVAQEKREFYRQTIGRLPSIPGESLYDVSFKKELRGSGTPGTPDLPIDALFQMCGFLPTIHTGVEAISAAVAKGTNGGVSPAPVITINTPAFNAKSGKLRLTLVSKTITNPEGAIFDGIFYPNDGSAAIYGSVTISDTAFAAVAFGANLAKFSLTVNDPDAGGVGDPVSTWQLGDEWTFIYTSASQVDVQYAPTSVAASASFFGPGKSATIKAYYDGTLRVLAGVIGSIKTTIEVSKIAYLEFKGMGIYAAPSDAAFPAQTYNTQKPEICVSSNFSIQGFTGIITKLDLDIANKVSKRQDSRSATGLLGFHITGREPVANIDPELELVASHDFIGRLKSGTEGALNIQVGQAAGNVCIIGAPKAQYLDVKDGDREGKSTLDIGMALNEDVGDDELTFTFS